MPIITKNEPLPAQPVITLIVGDPGVAKTSLANTCNNVLNIDFDQGFKRSYGRPDSLQIVNGWREVEQSLQSGDFDKYDTIVIDTAKGALDDFLAAYVMENDYKLKTNKLKMYGAIGDEFKLFISQLRRKNKDIFIIAHSKTQEEGDVARKVPDVTGQSAALLLRIADQVGFLSMRNGKRVLTFNPTDTVIGKNVAGLADIELPHHTSPDWMGFADREIMQKVKDALAEMSEEQRQALQLIEELRGEIAAILPAEGRDIPAELVVISARLAELKEEGIKRQLKAALVQHLKLIGYAYNAKEKRFESMAKPAEAPAPAAEVKAEPEPVKEAPKAEQPKAEAPAEEEEDLFAPQK